MRPTIPVTEIALVLSRDGSSMALVTFLIAENIRNDLYKVDNVETNLVTL